MHKTVGLLSFLSGQCLYTHVAYACVCMHTVHAHARSAAGGVGLAALKIAQRFNCTVLGTVGSPSKVQLLRDQFGPGR